MEHFTYWVLKIIQLQKKTNLTSDALLGLLSHSSLAVGLVVIGFLTFIRFDIMGLLFGDILAVNKKDLITIWVGGALILFVLRLIWKPLFASTVNYELAQAEGLPVLRVQFIFMIMISAIISLSIKIVGILLITSLLIIPSLTARRFSKTPEQMAIGGTLIGMSSVWLGLETSFTIDTPSGPSIVIASVLFFFLSNIFPYNKYK